MLFILIESLFGLVAFGALIVGAYWIRAARTAARTNARCFTQAQTIIAHLHQLALRVTADVSEHSDRIDQINGDLQTEGGVTAEAVLRRIEDIIQANQQMKDRLAETENRLHEQTKIIEAQATEVRTDPLTHVINRRGFDEELKRRFSESKRHGTPFCVMLLDLDRFKRLNDERGHQAGDEVLRAVAGVLIQTMRCSDLVSRYGGEEFAVILANTPLEEALLAAERARRAIEGKPFRFEGIDFSMTASFGVAQLRSSESTPLLIQRADAALYASKQAGRNNTHWHDGRTARPANYEASVKPESAQSKSDRQGPQAEPDIHVEQAASCASNDSDKTPMSRSGEGQVVVADALPPRAVDAHLLRRDEESLPKRREVYSSGNVATRTEFCRAVQCRLGEWKRGGTCFSVLLLSILDRQPNHVAHGEHQGESSPYAPHAALTAVVREMDLVAEFKPGCFGVLLPAVDQYEAATLAQRLGSAVEACFSSDASSLMSTVIAVGLAEVAEGDDMVRLLSRTEEALQHAVLDGGGGCFRHNGQWAERVAPLANSAAL